MEIIPQLEKRTHYLATFANLATLLGLLGTVSGLIHAFAAVATANPAEKANLLSASISEAMNCTAFGLMTAVPLLFVHALLQTKTTELIDSLETAAVKFLNALADRAAHRAESGAPRARPKAQHEDRHASSTYATRSRVRKPVGAAARADDRHLHGAGHVPADDRGVLAHHDPPARPAERGGGKRHRARRSGSR